ncbi:MAG: hypothetical protein OEZ36_12050 [Spirochaetota bacterium]|nr:hypothetical protein [Spirochaetota bacterium]
MKYVLYVSLLFFGFGQFLPVFCAPDFMRAPYYTCGYQILKCTLFLSVIILSILAGFKEKLKKIKVHWYEVVFFCLTYISLWSNRLFLHDVNNRIVVYINEGKKPENFWNPILGMKMTIHKNGLKDEISIYNNIQAIYSYHIPGVFPGKLYYKKNHGRQSDKYYGTKVYNKDWWGDHSEDSG